MTEEVLRTLMPEKRKFSRLYWISSNPLIVVVVGGLVAGLLTQYYTYRQKDIEFNRSFSNEMNKITIQKYGDVWERIDENELEIDSLLSSLQSPNMDDESRNKTYHDFFRLIHEDEVILSRNKFWIGEELYGKTSAYLDINIRYGLNNAMVNRDLTELLEKRKAAKHDLIQIRHLYFLNIKNLLLEGEPNPQPSVSISKKFRLFT
jgi:hypothetical protein